MKNILFILLALVFTTEIFAKGDEEIERKSIAPFNITERKIDKTLKKGEAKFEFKFYLDKGNYIGGIQIGIDDTSFTKTMNMQNVITETTKSGYHKLYFYVEGYYEVIADSIKIDSQEIIKAEIRFSSADPKMIITVDKPVIYVYSPVKTEMNIQLKTVGELGFTYPKYENGWDFTASENGNIEMNGKEFNYLFWESAMEENSLVKNKEEGFLVSKDELLPFLENSLEKMGFNTKESADFITYWYPQMMKNEKNHVQFLFNDACNAYAELEISPKPENLYRIGMIWCEAKTDFVPNAQKIPQLKREGLTVIEWGGSQVNTLFINEN